MLLSLHGATFAGVGSVPHQGEALSKGLHYNTSVAEAVSMVTEVGQMMDPPLQSFTYRQEFAVLAFALSMPETKIYWNHLLRLFLL